MTRQTNLGGNFTLAGTALNVNRMGYGAMQLAGPQVWGPPRDSDEAIRVLQVAVDAGVIGFPQAEEGVLHDIAGALDIPAEQARGVQRQRTFKPVHRLANPLLTVVRRRHGFRTSDPINSTIQP